MIANSIDSVILRKVEIQANGIIRNEKGRLIARLYDDVEYNSEHIKGLSTTTESQEADGEWIEKCFEDFWINGGDGTNSKKTMKELFKQAILSNFPKTNDKKIDELIEKNKVDIEEFEQWKKEEEEDGNQSEVTRYKALIIGRNLAIEDLTSLKSPTTTDE